MKYKVIYSSYDQEVDWVRWKIVDDTGKVIRKDYGLSLRGARRKANKSLKNLVKLDKFNEQESK